VRKFLSRLGSPHCCGVLEIYPSATRSGRRAATVPVPSAGRRPRGTAGNRRSASTSTRRKRCGEAEAATRSASVGIGFQATHTGNTAEPTSFTLNGNLCTVP
jgi:hypothetical protein